MKQSYGYIFLFLIALTACSSQNPSTYNGQSQGNKIAKEVIEYDDRDVVIEGYLDRSGNMWFTTLREGVFMYDGKAFKNFTVKDGLCSNKVNSVIEGKDGLMWFATAKGLCSYDGAVFANFPLPQEHIPSVSPETGLPSRKTEEILSIIQDSKGIFWLGTIASGAYRFDGETFTSFLRYKGRIQPDNVYNNCIQSIVEDEAGNIWFTSQTHGGISRYDGKEFIHFTKADGLPDDMIFSSFKDKDGKLWFGTLDEGLITYQEGRFNYLDETDGLCNNMVSSFCQDKTGKLWIGSFRESTVCWFDGQNFTSVPFDKDQKLVELRFIAEDKEGNIWFGGRYGILWRYDGKELEDFTYKKRNL